MLIDFPTLRFRVVKTFLLLMRSIIDMKLTDQRRIAVVFTVVTGGVTVVFVYWVIMNI